MSILNKIPYWVFPLLLGLIWLGYSQSRTRQVPLGRTAILPLMMSILSLQGTLKTFGAQPAVLTSWLLGALVAGTVMWRTAMSKDVRYNPHNRPFTVPGSWLPLALLMAVFVLKFCIGVLGATQPALLHQANITLALTSAFGACTGIFIARAACLWRLALQNSASQAPRPSRVG